MRKLKSMDWDRIRILPEVARTGMCVNRQHRTLIAPVRSIHCFALRNTDYRTTSICQAVQNGLNYKDEPPAEER